MSNISLIGFMGSGKTTIGKILAEKINFLFIDLDRIIELSENKTINEIFKINGEDYFRKIESKIIERIYSNTGCIFACGGGAVLRGENMKTIKKNSRVVYLEISPQEALHRLENCAKRPLIEKEDRLKVITRLLEKRVPLYEKYADILIKNEKISPEIATSKILEKI